MPQIDNARGILLMGLGMFLFSAVDTQAKFLTAHLHPIQIVWCRQLGLLFGIIVVLSLKGTVILRTRQPVLQIVRGSMAAISATLFIIGVSFVPLADAVAVAFVAPFMVTVMGALFLKEPVGIRRWTAVIIGFIGTLIVIRPGTGAIHPAVFLIVISATLFALRQIVSRKLASSDRTVTTVAYTALVGTVLVSIPLPFVWVWPSGWKEITMLVSIAILGGVAEMLVIKALEIAQAVAVAPLQYTMMIWGTIYGYLVFGQLPDMWTWVGTAIIIATGLYTLNRERIVMRQMRAQRTK